ncbi:hypothetical protein D3C72_1667550 [compost metagenome]
MHHAVDDGLAVLGLADLEITVLGRGLDKVAGRVDVEQPHPLAPDLAAEDQADIEFDAGIAQRVRVALVHLAHRVADDGRGFKHVARIPQRALVVVALRQDLAHRLADGEVAGGHQHHHAVAGLFEHRHLACRRDGVHPGVGAGIGQEYQAGIQPHGYTVRHGLVLVFLLDGREWPAAACINGF